jgi:Lipopolysaccharide-assembly
MRLGSGAALLLLGCLGCGYHTGGKAAILPTSIQTISIPAFSNGTQTYRVEQVLTKAVVREFITRTRYRIVNRTDPASDATLTGAVLAATATPLTTQTATGRVATVLVQVIMKVSLTDHKGKTLFENPYYLFREQYEVSTDPSTFFEESSPAMQRLSRDFAHTLVSDILENY